MCELSFLLRVCQIFVSEMIAPPPFWPDHFPMCASISLHSPNSLLLGFSMQLNPGSLGAGWCGSLPGLSSRFVSGCLRLSPFVCGSGSWLVW